ncbi:MAG: diguanylate cyclase [Campylobacterales bacterium]|nr:diguanylate cyclase [Campylobacterales bacterium]
MQNLDEILDQIVPIKIKDKGGVVSYVNSAFEEITKISKNDILGIKEELETSSNDYIKKEFCVDSEDQNSKLVQRLTSPLIDKDGIFIGEISVYIDVTEKKNFEKLSIIDHLTNLYNRRYFNEQLFRSIHSCKRDKKILCFAIMDIDNFKKYNDSHGHQDGDKALKIVSKSLADSIHRGSDYAFRLGGEEFGMLFEANSKDLAYIFIDNVRQNIQNLNIEHSLNGDYKVIIISAGLICVDFSVEDIDENGLYSMADHSLYEAKHRGRNKVVFHGSFSEEDDLEFF